MLTRKVFITIFAWALTTISVAQEKKPGWLLELVEARTRDVESAAAIATEGRQLYAGDEDKKTWDEYCKSAFGLALRGEFREAVRAATKAFFLGESEGSDVARAAATRDLGLAFTLAGDLEKAWHWTNESLKYSQGAGRFRDSILSAVHGQRSVIHQRRGAYEQALQELGRAMEHTLRPDRPYLQLRIARVEYQKGNAARASQLYAELLQEDSRSDIRSAVLRGQAEVSFGTGNATKSKQLYEEALKEADEAKAPLTVMWYRLGLARATLAIGDSSAAMLELDKAIHLAEGIAARFRSEEFRTGFFGDVQEVYELGIETAMDAGRHARAFEISEMSRARAFADLIRGRISHIGASPERPVPPDALAKYLPSDTALVAYHVLPKRTAVWILREGSAPIGKWLPIGTEELAKATRAIRQEIAEYRTDSTYAQALYKQLIEPLELKGTETLVLVPHRSLHFLPFQALRGPSGWLVEERPLAIAPSASSLATILSKPSIPADSLLALGNPSPIAINLPPLPGAENEIKKVASHFPKAVTYLRESATKSRILADGPANSVLHIAAHAEVDDIDPMYSRIHLAGTGTKSSDLEAHELYRVNFGNVRIVALSACNSGLGRVSGGDEFWGFKRTVLGAGARTLIASLWPVADDSTPVLMARFYESLKKMSGAESLRAGQLELIRSKEFAHPLYWGSFTLVGDWR